MPEQLDKTVIASHRASRFFASSSAGSDAPQRSLSGEADADRSGELERRIPSAAKSLTPRGDAPCTERVGERDGARAFFGAALLLMITCVNVAGAVGVSEAAPCLPFAPRSMRMEARFPTATTLRELTVFSRGQVGNLRERDDVARRRRPRAGETLSAVSSRCTRSKRARSDSSGRCTRSKSSKPGLRRARTRAFR